jgi:hypothetical protein
MTEERAALLGNELTEAADALHGAHGDFAAALIGRTSAQAAGMMVRVMHRIDALEEQVAELKKQIGVLKERERGL